MSYLDALTACLVILRKIKCVRVSSAKARGKANNYPYYGRVRYEIRLGYTGKPTFYAEERARSDRRVRALAIQDALELCVSESRYLVLAFDPGVLNEDFAKCVFQDVILAKHRQDKRLANIIGLVELSQEET